MKLAMHASIVLLAALSGEAVTAASYEASVTFGRRVELGLPVSGVVKSENVTTGQRVAAGQILLALDDTLFLAAMAQAEAGLVRCGADQSVATRDYQQAQQLYERSVLSNVELENAKLNVARADATCRQAQAHLTRAGYELEHSKIVAPFDGWVLTMRVQAGESVNSATEIRPLLVIAATGDYVARLRVPAKIATLVEIGRRAHVRVGRQQFEGWIATLALEPVNRESGDARYDIGVAFKTGDLLRGGQSAHVEFE